jgi:hypothetical protein
MDTLQIREPREWILEARTVAVLQCSGLLLACGGLPLFGWICHFGGNEGLTIPISEGQLTRTLLLAGCILLAALALVFAVAAFHEFCHGIAFRWAGAKPRYGARLYLWVFPVFYATAPGVWLSKRQFLVVLLAPTIVVNLIGAPLLLCPLTLRWLLVLAMAMHLGGCVGDWWMAVVVMRLPRGAYLEDTLQGFRFGSSDRAR